jgi:hypothetical protein
LKQSLNSLPQEYFEKGLYDFVKSNSGESNPGGALWGSWFINMIFAFGIPSAFIMPEKFPQYLVWCGRGLAFLCFAYIILCIAFGSQKGYLRHPIACIISAIIGFVLVQLTLWLIISEMFMLVYDTGMNASVEIDMEVIATVSIIAIIMLCWSVVINFVMWRRIRRQIIEGHFKANGGGFFGNWRHKDTAIAVTMAVCPVILTLSRVVYVASKLMSIETKEGLAPMAMVLLVLLLNVWFFLFSYINVVLIFRIYCIKRFGR